MTAPPLWLLRQPGHIRHARSVSHQLPPSPTNHHVARLARAAAPVTPCECTSDDQLVCRRTATVSVSSLSCHRSSPCAERPRSTSTAAPAPGGRSGTSVRGLGKRVGQRSPEMLTGQEQTWKASAKELARHRFELAPSTRVVTSARTRQELVHGHRYSNPERAMAGLARALTRALRECKHHTFTVSQCHSLTLRHVGVKCNLTRSDARKA
jgi:hypothetical protein